MKLFTATALLTAAAAVPAFAQSIPAVRAKIPFEFHVGKAVLPAGEYDIMDGLNRETIHIRSTDGKHSAIVITYSQDAPAMRPAEPSLTFRRVGGEAYLASVTRPASARDIRGPAGDGYTVLAVIKAAPVR
ncbi:MAG TPA: hypothetical protein VFL57_03175 [Bryobacteraceae bacterium]|nr:hypothetical protein [Bryobacteraceae bacterium]